MLSQLAPHMTATVRAKYATDLLLDSYQDFVHELRTAWRYLRLGYAINWYEPNQERHPEFRVIGFGQDVDVECRRIRMDHNDKIKSPAVAQTCDEFYRTLRKYQRWGTISAEIPEGYRFDSSRRKSWHRNLGQALSDDVRNITLDGQIMLDLDLQLAPSREFTPEEMQRWIHEGATDQFSFVATDPDAGRGRNPVVIRCRGPRRSPTEFRDSLYSTFREKVALQLHQDRPGLLVVLVEGVREPDVFLESDGFKSIVGRLFKQPQLVSIIVLCQESVSSDESGIASTTSAAVFHNPDNSFPGANAMSHFASV
jgi:hypothetical protein